MENSSCFSWVSGWNRCCWSFLSQWIEVKEEYDILWTPERKEAFPYWTIYLADLWYYIDLTLTLDILPEEPGTKTGKGKIHRTCLEFHWINLAIPPFKEFPAQAPGWQEPRKGWWSEDPGKMNSLPRVRNGVMRWPMLWKTPSTSMKNSLIFWIYRTERLPGCFLFTTWRILLLKDF